MDDLFDVVAEIYVDNTTVLGRLDKTWADEPVANLTLCHIRRCADNKRISFSKFVYVKSEQNVADPFSRLFPTAGPVSVFRMKHEDGSQSQRHQGGVDETPACV